MTSLRTSAWEARAGLELTRFSQALANYFKLNAYYRVVGTLS